jgi:anti-sigma factor RsiW
MICPLDDGENAQQLLDYCTRKLDRPTAEILEKHMAICPACREFAAQQRAVWEALDGWEAEPVSADFDRRLYRRIEEQVSWWQRLTRPLRPLASHWNVAASAAGVFVVLAAGLLLNQRPAAVVERPNNDTAQVDVQQVEHALDAMDLLSDFDHRVKAGSNAKM